jgi:hypothetical protein
MKVHFLERERPRAARRLLQPNRSTSTTVDDPNPAHHDSGLPPSQLFSRVAAAEQSSARHQARSLAVAVPWCHRGQPMRHGPGVVSSTFPSLCGLDASRRDRSRRELCPAPLSSDTSRCKLVAVSDGASRHRPGAVTGVHSELAITKRGERLVRKVPAGYADPSVRVAPDSIPRRIEPGAVPEVPSVVGQPLGGSARPQSVPRLWIMLAPFQSPQFGS